MDINRFTKEVESTDWHSFKWAYYIPESVPLSLMSLALAEQETKQGIAQIAGCTPDLLLNAPITNDVMFAIGNNHNGTYYPVIRKALPFIIQIALFGNHIVSRNCAINILIDLYYFTPEFGTDELEEYVKETIRNIIAENRENFLKFATDDMRNKSLIESLISIIDEPD